MATAPVFFVTPRHAVVNSGASANSVKTLAGANNTVAVITGIGSPGTVIERVRVIQNGTGASTANNICRFYIFDGTSYALVSETNLGGSITPSATVVGINVTIPDLVGLKLPSALHVLHVGFSAAAAGDTFAVTAQVADSA